MASLNEGNFDLCNSECKRLIDKYGHKTPISDYPEATRCVVLVWTSLGKIENGGFIYLFGAILPGDPYYEFTLFSYKKIGCFKAYEAFKNALALFPNCKPPLNDRNRI
ncbi:MAG: DMP19 family protein, partial [bacterium]|nr:DMP19 family protein [bacterium]